MMSDDNIQYPRNHRRILNPEAGAPIIETPAILSTLPFSEAWYLAPVNGSVTDGVSLYIGV